MNILYVSNAFSLSMIDRESQKGTPRQQCVPVPVTLEQAQMIVRDALARPTHETVVSAIGHADTARLISAALGIDLPMQRKSVRLIRERPCGSNPGQRDRVLVAQYVGPRLPEGATQLPERSGIEWWIV